MPLKQISAAIRKGLISLINGAHACSRFRRRIEIRGSDPQNLRVASFRRTSRKSETLPVVTWGMFWLEGFMMAMEISFREFNPFDIWFWLEFETAPSSAEREYVEEVFNAWFYLGKLSAFNAENLQVQDTGVDLNYLDYDGDRLRSTLMAPMHNMGEFEYKSRWGRCWFDLGMSDLIAVDALINALYRLSEEYVPLRRLIVGGVNEDWPVANQNADDWGDSI